MNEEEKKAFTLSFQNNLDNLVRNKINPTAEAIISAEMPMIYLFEDLMNKIDKQQEEIKARLEEIEKLKSRKYIFNAETNEIKEIPISDDYVSKDKIREKIKELEKEIESVNENCPDFTIIYEHEVDTYGIINVLKELLGE